jgi:imidazolonepropionase
VVKGTRDYAVVNATLLTLAPFAQADGSMPADEAALGIVRGGTVVVRAGRIAAVGTHTECSARLNEVRAERRDSFEEFDVHGAIVMPGMIDSHTHALFAGDRVQDFDDIAAGRKPSLGIAYTVEQTRKCTSEQLIEIGGERLSLMADHGTTTAEVKTGYALTTTGECSLLSALSALDARPAIPHVIPTFCGAHALPPEFTDPDAFVDMLISETLPAVAAMNVARFADAFCETGYFSVEQCRRFLRACAARDLKLRIHADELQHSGGSMLAAELDCTSADHLNFADASDIAALARAGCVAVLCPTTTEYLGLARYAPARELIAAGVPVALATDFNPGTSPCFSLQTVAHLARRRLRMTAAETIAAVTSVPAASLGIEKEAGSIEPGKRADLAVLQSRDYREFGYFYGVNLTSCVAIGR